MKCHACGGAGWEYVGVGESSLMRCEHCDGTGNEDHTDNVRRDEQRQRPPDEPPHPAEG